MTRIIFYIFCFNICCLVGLNAQSESIREKLIFIDGIKNDSLALGMLEALATNSEMSIQLQLDISKRIISRANVLQKFDKAISLGNASLVLAHNNDLDSLEAVFNKLIGVSYYYMDQKRSSIPYFEKALTIAIKNGFWELEASCNNNIGAAFTDVQEYKKAEPYLLRSIEIMKGHGQGNSIVTLRTYRVLARFYSESGESEKAEIIYKELIKKSKQIKDTAFLCENLLFYSEMLSRRGEVDKAIEMSGEALAYMRGVKNNHELQGALTIHSINLVAAGRYKEAYELIAESNTVMRSTFAKDLEKQVSEVEVKYNTAQIKQDKEFAELNATKQRQVYLFSFGGLLILLVAGIYIWNQRKNSRQKIFIQKQRLETLIEGEEKERLRIARDLHDGIVQDLTAIKLKHSETLKQHNKDIHPNNDKLSADLDHAINEVRNIAYQMMPLALKEYGLVPALEDLLRKVLVPQQIKYEFEAIDSESEDGNIDVKQRLPEKVELCLYRVSQEFLNNIVKHSEATSVSFTLTKQKSRVTLICEDNGKGFDENEIKKGIGMNGLTTRLEMLNGTIRFESPNHKGTMVMASLPL